MVCAKSLLWSLCKVSNSLFLSRCSRPTELDIQQYMHKDSGWQKKYCLVVHLPSPGEVCKKIIITSKKQWDMVRSSRFQFYHRMWNTSDLEWKKELLSFLWDPLIKIFVGFDRIFSNCFSQQCINIVRKEVKYQCPKSS